MSYRTKYRAHSHECENAHRGCANRVSCNGWPERDEDGNAYCEFDGEHLLCEECYDATTCDDCGAFEHLKEAHANFCEHHPLQRDDSPEAKSRPLDGAEAVGSFTGGEGVCQEKVA